MNITDHKLGNDIGHKGGENVKKKLAVAAIVFLFAFAICGTSMACDTSCHTDSGTTHYSWFSWFHCWWSPCWNPCGGHDGGCGGDDPEDPPVYEE